MTYSLILPVRNGGKVLARALFAVAQLSEAPVELIATDTESTDDSRRQLLDAGFNVLDVKRHEFHHGRTRNEAAALATSDILVFATQDAVIATPETYSRLIAPIRDGVAVAAFARQVAASTSNPLEQFARSQNYPTTQRVVSDADVTSLGIRAFFFSNATSAVRRDVFNDLGGFPMHTIMNEDMLFAARVLRAGHKIAYAADAVVEHSHDYSLLQTFKRYFDIGVVFEQAQSDLKGVETTGEGLRYFKHLLRWLWSSGQKTMVPKAVLESACKWGGVFIGKRHRRIPLWLKRRLTMHRDYWSVKRDDGQSTVPY